MFLKSTRQQMKLYSRWVMRPAVDVHGARAANTLSTGAPAVVGEEAADTDKRE